MRIFTLLFLATCLSLHADTTNFLTLTWALPVGYTSTLYTATNLNGTWSAVSTNPPPYTTFQTNPVCFFTVIVAPPAQSSVTYSNWSGGAPTYVPTGPGGLSLDISDGALWEYYLGGWH